MKEVIGYEAIHIIVDCKENDSVDIKCGGPNTLGYDFYVDSDRVDEMIIFIKKEIKNAGQPVLNIYKANTTIVKELWTKELISECIQNGY